MRKGIKTAKTAALCGVAVSLLAALLTVLAPGARAAKFSDSRVDLVSEPGNMDSGMEYYAGGEKTGQDQIQWVEGRNGGQAVSLNGNGQYLRLKNQSLFAAVDSLTFSGWFYWRGAAEGLEEESQYKQHLFTLGSDLPSNLSFWTTVMPFAKELPDSKIVSDARPELAPATLNGLYTGYWRGQNNYSETEVVDYWRAVDPEDQASNGLPQDGWHHVAWVSDWPGRKLYLYIDGQMFFETTDVYANQLRMRQIEYIVLGTGFHRWSDTPTLNALVDDVSIYNVALTGEQVQKLYHDLDPLDGEAALPAETTAALPTGPYYTWPTVAATEPAQADDGGYDEDAFNLDIPDWLYLIVFGMLGLFLVLTVLGNMLPAPPKKAKKGAKTSPDDPDGQDDDWGGNPS